MTMSRQGYLSVGIPLAAAGCRFFGARFALGTFIAGTYDFTLVSKRDGNVRRTQKWFGIRVRSTEFPLAQLKTRENRKACQQLRQFRIGWLQKENNHVSVDIGP